MTDVLQAPSGDSPPVYNKLQLQQITIPPELPSILKLYAKAAIRTQPSDLLVWSAAYFKALSSGIPPPVKERIEYPRIIIASGLTPGFLKVLINQIGRDETKVIPKSTLVERWTDICLSKEALEEIFNVGAFHKDTVTWLKFVAICAGYLESRLSRTMVLLIELLNMEPEENVPIIPVKKFLILYRFLAVMDCGPVDQRRSTTCDVSSLGTEVSPVAGHLTNTRTPEEDAVVPEVKSVEPAIIKEIVGHESENEFINNDDNKNNPDKVINEDNQIEIEENDAEIKEPVANTIQSVDDMCAIETDGEGSKPFSPTITPGIDAVEEENSNAESHVTGENLSRSDSSTSAENKERIAVNLHEVDDDSKEAEVTKGKEEIECPADKTGENEMDVQKTVDVDNVEEEEKKSDNLETKDETIIPTDKTDEAEEEGEKNVDMDDSGKDEEQPAITSDTKNGTPVNESPTNKTEVDEDEEEEMKIDASDEIQEPRVTPETEDEIIRPTNKNEQAEEVNNVNEGNGDKEGEHYGVTPEIKDAVGSLTEKTEEGERENENIEDENGDIKEEELQKDIEDPAESEKEVTNNIDENNKTEEFGELENDQRDNEISGVANDENRQHLEGMKTAEDSSETAREEKEADETEQKENDENEGKTNEEDQTGHEKLEATAEIITNDEEPGVTSDTKNGTPINESATNKTEADDEEEEEAIDKTDEIQEEEKDKLSTVDNEESSEKEEEKTETEEETKNNDLEEPSEEGETGEENIALGTETNKEEEQGRESHVEKEVIKEEVAGEVEMATETEEPIEPEDEEKEVQQEEQKEKIEVEEGQEKSESEEIVDKENCNEYEHKDNEVSSAENDEVGQQESEDKQNGSDQEKPPEVENEQNDEIDQEQIEQLTTQENVEPIADITYSDNTSEHSEEKQDMKPETDKTEAGKTAADDAKEVGEISESDNKISTFDNIESLDVNSIKGFDEEDGRIITQEEEKTENSAKLKTLEVENLTETVQTNESVKESIEEDSLDVSDDGGGTEEKSADHGNGINEVEAIDNVESSADINNKEDNNLQELEYRKTDDETIANELLQVIEPSSDENITRDVETGKNGNEETTEEDCTNNNNETFTSNPDNKEEEEPKEDLITNEEINKSGSKIDVNQENDTTSLECHTANDQLNADNESSKQRADLEHVDDVHTDPNDEETVTENGQEIKDPETGIVTKPSGSSQEITDTTENGYILDECTTEESDSKTDDKDKESEFSEVKKENNDITVEEEDDDGKSSIVKENDRETQKSFDETEDILQADVISLQQSSIQSELQSKSNIIENGELNEKDSDNMNEQKINIVRGEETLDELLHMVDTYKEDSQSTREHINDDITTNVKENQDDIELNNNKETEEDLPQSTDQLNSESVRSGRSRFAGVVKSGAEWSTLPAYYAYIPGIGPPVPEERIDRVEKYLTEVSARQAGYVMASNLRHYLCPPLDP